MTIKSLRHHDEHKGVYHAAGYTNEKEYLNSPEWAAILAEQLQRHPRCLACWKPASKVYRLSHTAPVLLGMEKRLLASLCGDCLRWIEFDGPKKLRWRQANKKLYALVTNKEWHANVKAGFARLRKLLKQERERRPRKPKISQATKKQSEPIPGAKPRHQPKIPPIELSHPTTKYGTLALYLQSDDWKKIRDRKLALEKHACEYCWATAETTEITVRHLRLKNLGKESSRDLVVVCTACANKYTTRRHRR